MGTDVEVLAVGADDAAMATLGALAVDALEAREARWSRFRPTSELCRVNDAAGAPVVVSPDTFALIALAVDAWRDTGGRYDPTVLAALEAAGYDRDFDALARR
jgi:thiamine biosynthesis lipoprotein